MKNVNRSAAHERLVDEILVAVSATGLARVWRQPTGAAYRAGRLVRYGKVGAADITGLLINGRRVEIEVKTGGGVQSAEQKIFEDMITKMGGLYLVARQIEDAVKQITASL